MDPASPEYGSVPADQPPHETVRPSWAAPPPPSREYAPTPPAVTRARTWVIVLVAALTELVAIAAADNQWVSDNIARAAIRTDSVGARELARSWLTYTWRFSPRTHLTSTFWSEIALVLVTIVLSCLLIAAVVRGPVTFLRAFFGTWTAVVAATLVGAFVRGLIDDTVRTPGYDRVTGAAFGNAGPTSHAVVAGFGLGLAVALITAVAAVASRRSARPAAHAASAPAEPDRYAPPDQPPPFFGEPGGSPARPWQDQRYGPPPRHSVSGLPDAGATTQLPPVERDVQPESQPGSQPGSQPDEPTTQLPAQPADGEQATTQFPRPPDDDALGSAGEDPHRS